MYIGEVFICENVADTDTRCGERYQMGYNLRCFGPSFRLLGKSIEIVVYNDLYG